MAAPTNLSGASYVIKVNGKDLHEFGVLSYRIPHHDMASLEFAYDTYPGEHEAMDMEATFSPRPFVVTGSIFGDSVSALRTNIDSLKSALVSLRGKQSEIVAPIQLSMADQTDRYYPCAYKGLQIASSYDESTTNEQAIFTLTLMMLSPFAEATSITTATPSGTGPSFTTLTLGTAPSWLLLELEGAATAPDFALANMAFYADFDYDLSYTKIDGSTASGSCGAAVPSDQTEPGEWGGRYSQLSTFTTSFASVVNNIAEQTWIMAIRPQFGVDPGADVYVFEFYVDANNTLYLVWDDSENKWTLVKVIGGAAVTLAETTASTHASDDYMVLAVSFGADGMKIYKNGTKVGSNATATGITGSSGTLYLGNQGATARPNAKYMRMIALPFQLSDDDVARYSTWVDQLRPYNVKKSLSNTIAANARMVIDFKKGTAISLATTLAQTNGMSNFTDSQGFPILTPPKICFHVPASETIGGVKVAYRKRYL